MHLPGFEPGTFRVWGECDNQLHHKCLSIILVLYFLNTPKIVKSSHNYDFFFAYYLIYKFKINDIRSMSKAWYMNLNNNLMIFFHRIN